MMNRQLLPYLDGFRDELEKIALVGTALGAAGAYALSPNSLKGKVIGTAIGAGAGYGADRLARVGKNVLHDEHERERSALQNYVPSTVSHNSPYGSHVW